MALPIDGGEASVLFSVPFKAGKALPLGGGSFAFTAPFAMRGEPDVGFDVLEDIPFWSNGAGFTAGKRNQLYVYGPEAGAVRLTEPPFTVAGFTVSDGGYSTREAASRTCKLCATASTSGTAARAAASWSRTDT